MLLAETAEGRSVREQRGQLKGPSERILRQFIRISTEYTWRARGPPDNWDRRNDGPLHSGPITFKPELRGAGAGLQTCVSAVI